MNAGRPLRVLVAEDEVMNRRRLVRLLEEAGCQVVAALPDGAAVARWLREDGLADALFLDVRMPGKSGLALLKEEDLPPTVLVTAHEDHAVEAFDAEAVDYLLKPVTQARLARALERVQQRLLLRRQGQGPAAGPPRFPVRAGEGLIFLDLGKVTHFEVVDEVVFAHAGALGRQETLWKALSEVELAFPAAGLLRLHRHLLVRPEAIVGVRASWNGRMKVTLQGGAEVEASRGATPRLKARMGLG